MGAWRPLNWIIDWEKWCLGIIGDGIRGVITVHFAGNEQGGDDEKGEMLEDREEWKIKMFTLAGYFYTILNLRWREAVDNFSFLFLLFFSV